jgi:hypothetical protein
VSPVLAALESIEPALETPLAARAALDKLAQEPSQHDEQGKEKNDAAKQGPKAK